MEKNLELQVFHEDISWKLDLDQVDYNTILFEKLFFLLIGKAWVLDEILWHENLEQQVFHEDIPWKSDPDQVDYNTTLFEKFSPLLKAKHEYGMRSCGKIALNQIDRTNGRSCGDG